MVEHSDEDDEKQWWTEAIESLLAEAEILEGLVADIGFKSGEDFGLKNEVSVALLEAQAHTNNVLDELSQALETMKEWHLK